MNARLGLVLGAAMVALLAIVPMAASGYQLALGISLLYFTVLATAWALTADRSRAAASAS